MGGDALLQLLPLRAVQQDGRLKIPDKNKKTTPTKEEKREHDTETARNRRRSISL